MSYGNEIAGRDSLEACGVHEFSEFNSSCHRCKRTCKMGLLWSDRTCARCLPVVLTPRSDFNPEQDMRDEAAEMSWLALSGRWV